MRRASSLLTLATTIGLASTPASAQPLLPYGPAFQVNTYIPGYQYRADVAAAANGGYVVVWQSFLEDGAGTGVFGRRFDAAGALVGTQFQINASTVGSEGYPAVAVEANGDFVVVWQVYGSGLRGRRFASSGGAIGNEFDVNEFSPQSPAKPAVASDADGDFVVAWQSLGVDGSSWAILARRFGSNGVPITSDFLVNSFFTSYQGVPAVASGADGRFVVVWESYNQDGSRYGIFGQRVTSTGQFVGGEFRINPITSEDQSYPSVAMDADGDFVVAWQSRAGQDGTLLSIIARRYDSAGSPLDYEIVVNARTAGAQVSPDVSVEPDGGFVVTWATDDDGGPAAGIALRRFTSSGVPQGTDSQVSGATNTFAEPRVAADADGDPLVIWNAPDGSDLGVHARRYNAPSVLDVDGNGSFTALTDALLLLRYGLGSTGAALTNSAVGLACTRCTPSTVAAYLDGLAVADALTPTLPVRAGVEFQINTYTTDSQYNEALAAGATGDFVVLWRSFTQDGSGRGVFGRRFGAQATPLGQEFRVNSFTPQAQEYPEAVVAPDGGFVVVWDSAAAQDGSDTGIFAQRFAASGAALAQEFQVNAGTIGQQEEPAIAREPNGDFVVVWHSTVGDGSGWGLFGRRFSASGAAIGGEFQISSYTVGNQRDSAIASEANGDFVAVWGSFGQDGSNYGVFARRFTSAGTPLAPEFQVNALTAGNQLYTGVASDSDGDFAVVWWALDDGDGSGSAVRARRFDSAGAPRGAEFVVNATTFSSQVRPGLAMEPDGDFIVVWLSAYADNPASSDYGVVARRFASSGVPLGGEFLVNTYTPPFQTGARVTTNAGGDFLITWNSTHDGDSHGVFGQRFVVPKLLDVDGNGTFGALTDGLLVLRFAFGFTGATLINGAVGPGCTRCDATSIASYIASPRRLL